MNIIFSSNEKYLKYACVMLTSICVNNPEHIDAYLLHGGISEHVIEGFVKNMDACDITLHPVFINPERYNNYPGNDDWPTEIYFRLGIPWLDELRGVDRAFYFDVDVIVNSSLSEFYNMNLEEYDLAAARDSNGSVKVSELSPEQRLILQNRIPEDGYFNSGMMLMNLKRIRREYPEDVYIGALEEWKEKVTAPDQDILNYVHAGHVYYADWAKYDLFARTAHDSGMEYETVKETVSIFHFAGKKPWNSTGQIHYDIEKVWWEYASGTPYYQELLSGFVWQALGDDSIESNIRALMDSNSNMSDSIELLKAKLSELVSKREDGNPDSAESQYIEQCNLSRQFLEYVWPKVKADYIWDHVVTECRYDLAVIIPCYNARNYVEDSVESVLDQMSDGRIQLILVDDGATDGTGEIVDRYSGKEHVTVIHQENQGTAGALNTGIKASSSRYILMLGDDDFIPGNQLVELLDWCIRLDADIIESEYIYITDETKRTDYTNFEISLTEDSFIKKEWHNMSGYPGGKIYRRHLFDKVCHPQGIWFEDSIIQGLIMQMALVCYSLKEPCFCYRRHAGSVTAAANGNPRSIESFYIMEDIIDLHCQLGLAKTQGWYEYILKWIALTYARTDELDANVKTAIFYVTAELFNREFVGGQTSVRFFNMLERALRSYKYPMYEEGCRVAWTSVQMELNMDDHSI